MQTVVAMRENKGPDTLFAGPPDAGPLAPAERAQAAQTRAAAPLRHGFAPLLLGLLALLGWLGFQAWLLDSERQQLQAARAAQQPQIDTAGGLRRALDLLAADTQRLADAGNGNARVLVDELRKRGITINAASNNTTSAGNPAAGAASGPGR